MFDVLRDYRTILMEREIRLSACSYPYTVAVPRCRKKSYSSNKNRNLDLLKKVDTHFKHGAHDACSLYAHQQIVRSHLLHLFGTMTHRKEQMHYYANCFCIGLYMIMDAPTWLQNPSACLTGS